MVHLAQVRNDPNKGSEKTEFGAPRRRSSVVPGLEHISLEPPGEDEFSTSVYGSRFAAEDLPAHEMPEKEMPKEIAYRMIKDELSLDGNPMLK
jgi:glutamate decarboxylase